MRCDRLRRGLGKVMAVVAGLAFFWGIPGAGPAQAQTQVRIGGAGTALGTMRMLAGAYEKSHPGVKILIYPSLGSSGGIKALISGALDIAVSGRTVKPAEQQKGAVAKEYARSPFLFAAHPGVNKSDISTAELERIYAGQVRTWPDGSQLRLVLRPEGDTDTKIVSAISPALARAAKAAGAREGMIYAVTDQECGQALARIPGALGPSTLTEVMTEQKALRVLSFNGVKPSVQALAEGKYPLVKPLFLVTVPKTPAAAQEFARFVASAKARRILEKSGNISTAAKE